MFHKKITRIMISSEQQRTIGWFRDRLGIITGSKIGSLMKAGKGEPFSATAKGYLYQLAGERALSKDIVNDDEMFQFYLDQTSVTSKAMRFGTEQEANARVCYSDVTGNEVIEVGLCKHPTIPYIASSPDGIVRTPSGEIGCLEIKCPTLQTYAQYCAEINDADGLLKVNPDYYYQCQSHIACTGAAWCDFAVYCPFTNNPIHIVRIERNDEAITRLIDRSTLAEQFIENLKLN